MLILPAIYVYSQQQPLEVESYQDTYLGSHFTQDHTSPDFFYNHKLLNRPSVNLFLLKTRYNDSLFRVELTLMAGDYATCNLNHEPKWAKTINTFCIAYKLQKNATIDAGVFGSHLGIESPVSGENYLLTRSIVSENTPYYFSGIRYVFDNKRLNYGIFLLNGWQRIAWTTNYSTPALGTALGYIFNSGIKLQYNLFLGSALPDSLKRYRCYNHFNSGFVKGAFECYSTFDVGFEYGAFWLSPQVMGLYRYTSHAYASCRLEWFYDPEHRQISNDNPLAFNTYGIAFCHTAEPIKDLLLRVEPKYYWSPNGLFKRTSERFYITAGISYRLKIY